MDSVLTAEVAAAGSADDDDAEGKAEGYNSIVSQWERWLRRSSERGLKDWERRRVGHVAVQQSGCFCIGWTMA